MVATVRTLHLMPSPSRRWPRRDRAVRAVCSVCSGPSSALPLPRPATVMRTARVTAATRKELSHAHHLRRRPVRPAAPHSTARPLLACPAVSCPSWPRPAPFRQVQVIRDSRRRHLPLDRCSTASPPAPIGRRQSPDDGHATTMRFQGAEVVTVSAQPRLSASRNSIDVWPQQGSKALPQRRRRRVLRPAPDRIVIMGSRISVQEPGCQRMA